MLIVLFMLGLIAGVAMTVRGLRGRRVGMIPHCAHCDYPLAHDAGDPPRCPECGRASAPVIGMRVWRGGHLHFGVVLSVVSAGSLAIIAWGKANDVDWIRYRPESWLIGDGRTDDASGLRARKELYRRIQNDSLSPSAINRILDLAMPADGDRYAIQHWLWLPFVEEACAGGHVSLDYLESLVHSLCRDLIFVEVRPQVRAGSVIETRLSRRSPGSQWIEPSPFVTIRIDALEIRIGDCVVEPDWMPQSVLQLVEVGHSFLSRITLKHEDCTPGETTVTYTVQFSVASADDQPAGYIDDRPSQRDRQQPTYLFQWEQDISSRVTIVPVDAPTVPIIENEAGRRWAEEIFKFSSCLADYTSDGRWRTSHLGGHGYLTSDFPSGVELAYDIIWRSADQEWLAGAIYSEAQNIMQVRLFPFEITDLDESLTHVDVILRPNPAVQEQFATLVSPILGGEVVFRDIPIRINRWE